MVKKITLTEFKNIVRNIILEEINKQEQANYGSITIKNKTVNFFVNNNVTEETKKYIFEDEHSFDSLDDAYNFYNNV